MKPLCLLCVRHLGGARVFHVHLAGLVSRWQAFREDEAVDVSNTANGYYVGWMRIDEYLRFTVNVTEDGTRQITRLRRCDARLFDHKPYVLIDLKYLRHPAEHFYRGVHWTIGLQHAI